MLGAFVVFFAVSRRDVLMFYLLCLCARYGALLLLSARALMYNLLRYRFSNACLVHTWTYPYIPTDRRAAHTAACHTHTQGVCIYERWCRHSPHNSNSAARRTSQSCTIKSASPADRTKADRVPALSNTCCGVTSSPHTRHTHLVPCHATIQAATGTHITKTDVPLAPGQ